jgi:hypothetical protein
MWQNVTSVTDDQVSITKCPALPGSITGDFYSALVSTVNESYQDCNMKASNATMIMQGYNGERLLHMCLIDALQGLTTPTVTLTITVKRISRWGQHMLPHTEFCAVPQSCHG